MKQQDKTLVKKGISELSGEKMGRLKLESADSSMKKSSDLDGDVRSSGQVGTSGESNSKNFLGGPSSWYSTLPQLQRVLTKKKNNDKKKLHRLSWLRSHDL